MTITSLPATVDVATPNDRTSRASTSAAPNNTATPRQSPTLRSTSPAAKGTPLPDADSPPEADFPPTKYVSPSNDPPSAGPDEPSSDQGFDDPHMGSVGVGLEPDRANRDQPGLDHHGALVAVGPILYDPSLYLLAAQLDAIEGLRLATANRHRMATRDVADSDGLMRGLGLTEDNPAVMRSAVMLDALKKTEHEVVLGLNRLMRAHPLGPWQKATRGVGEKQLARLLACIGDPYWNTASDRPRTVSQLWAYCGLHVLPAGGSLVHTAGEDPGHKRGGDHTSDAGIAARRAKGQRANWSTDAKTKAYLIAESCLKAGSYRDVYDDHKARAAVAVHAVDCAPCKAKARTPLALGHQHARAMRAMSKAILKDLWIEARRLHGEVSS